jgi:GNAT superfamily N-acetyltransferase/Zn-dependent protease
VSARAKLRYVNFTSEGVCGCQLDHEILVREMLDGEESEVRDFFEENLGIIDRIIFPLAFRDSLKSAIKQLGTTFVAICDGKVVGSVSLRIVVYAEKRIGLIDAIVADKDLRGRGIGKSLLDEALSWFEKKGCELIYATVDRFNSPSWNMFIHKGFSPHELRGQLRDLGPNFIRLWFTEFYIIGGGTFFLKKTSEKEGQTEAGEGWHFLVAWLGLAFISWMMALRQGASFDIPLTLGVAGFSLFSHELAHKLAASRFGLKTTFKAWDSGILFGSLLAAILGAFYPAYGSTYIKQVDYRYNPKQREIGSIYAAGPIVSFILAALFWASLLYSNNALLLTIGKMGYVTNYVLVFFNLIPIQAAGGFAWDGRKIYTWNKAVWTLLVIALALLILSDRLI